MKLNKLREWNENGFLQAAIDGNLQVKVKDDWKDVINIYYDIDTRYEYRIKPNFEIGDLVKIEGGSILPIIGVYDNYIHIQSINTVFEVKKASVVKVKQILKPHTFETAVKDCAENGFDLKYGSNKYDTFKITDLLDSLFYIERNLGPIRYTDFKEYKFPNNKPFCQVEYEECT
jgi:hypothetical protein